MDQYTICIYAVKKSNNFRTRFCHVDTVIKMKFIQLRDRNLDRFLILKQSRSGQNSIAALALFFSFQKADE